MRDRGGEGRGRESRGEEGQKERGGEGYDPSEVWHQCFI